MKSLLLTLLWLSVGLPSITCAQSTPAAGFGRFGRFNEDGLLTLNVSPHGFAMPPTATPLTVSFGAGTARGEVRRLDTTGKTLRLMDGGPSAPTELRYTLLYPGFSATYGRQMRLQFSDGQGKPTPVSITLLPPVQESGFCAGLLIRRKDTAAMPLLIAFRAGFQPHAQNLKAQGEAAELLMEGPKTAGEETTAKAAHNEIIGEVRFVTPLGLGELPPVASMAEENRLRAAARRWAAIPIPIRERSESRLSANGQTVTFTETYRTSGGVSIAPLPPVLAFARTQGYPVHVDGVLTSTDCRTKWGNFAYVRGSALRYTLPVPPTDERGYIRVPSAVVTGEQENNSRLLNDLVGHLGGDWAVNAVDLGYAGMANAQMAWAYLPPARRAELDAAWRQYLPRAFALPPYPQASTLPVSPNLSQPKPPVWKSETEPLTRQSYLWTYFIGGPNDLRYDLDWGNALPLYGLYKYAAYTGDWNFVRTHWNDVRRIYRYFDLGDDWAWMTVVNADHGYSTGTGDPMAATFCGTLACLKMARVLHDRTGERHFAAQSARIAVPMVSRFWYTAWARKAGLIGPKSVVLGFHEMEGFTRARLGEDDPWDTTSALSGDGVLPELYAALLAFGGKALADYEAEYARGYPDWYRGDVAYPFPTTYKGNSVYVTFPHIFARARLDEPTPALWNYVTAAQTNRNNAWVGPNILAELLSRPAPLLLTEWQPAAYRDGVMSPDGRRVRLDFHLDKPTAWNLTARAQNRRVPVAVKLNGRPIPFHYQASRLTIALQTQGDFQLEILFAKRLPQGDF